MVRRRRAVGPGAQAGTLRMTASGSYRHRGGIPLARSAIPAAGSASGLTRRVSAAVGAAASGGCAAAVVRHGHDRGQAAAVVLADADDAAATLAAGG